MWPVKFLEKVFCVERLRHVATENRISSKIRLKDVAERAGVAVNTASTILNRRSNSWASKATEARVFKAAEDLGYRPNRAALALRMGRSNAIGLLIPDLHNPFYTAFADLLEMEAERAGCDLVIESWRTSLEREQHCLSEIVERQVDGVAAFLSDNETHRAFLAGQFDKGRPFVALSVTGGPALPVDSVLTDFSTGLHEAVDALCALGHRSFVFVCALSEGQGDGNRPALFRQMLSEKGISENGFEFVRSGPEIEDARSSCAEFFQHRQDRLPTALIALNDLSAIGAMRAAADRGLVVPRDLSVVGVDNIPLAQFLPVSLSTIAQPIREMAQRTSVLLLDRIANGRQKSHREQAVFSTRFIPRESIGPARRTGGQG